VTGPFRRVRGVRALPFDVAERAVGVVLSVENEGLVRLKLTPELAHTLSVVLENALEKSEGTQGPAHCAARQDDGRGGEARPAGPCPSHPESVDEDDLAAARLRGAVDRGRGRGRFASPYADFVRTAAWLRGFDEAKDTPR
jgi:hypothetical protein